MGPFNIKIVHKDLEITLTILPDVQRYYSVIYFGGVIGAVKYNNKEKCWKWLSADQIHLGNLPLYKPEKNNNRPELITEKGSIENEQLLKKIGNEIEYVINP